MGSAPTSQVLSPVYHNWQRDPSLSRGNRVAESSKPTEDITYDTSHDLRSGVNCSPEKPVVTTPLRPTALPFVPDRQFHLEQSVGILTHVVEEQHAALKAQARRIEVLKKVIEIQNAGLVTSQGVADRARRVLLPEGNFEDEIEAIIDAEINISQLIGSTRETVDTELGEIGMQDVLKSS